MDIQREEHGRKGAFFIDEGGEWVAELTYIRSGENIITVDHTEVDPKLQGQNVGRSLVEAAVKYARENGLKIDPACQYTKKVIDSTPEFQDVLASE
jgi:predicted GNAT family acetyltransferase